MSLSSVADDDSISGSSMVLYFPKARLDLNLLASDKRKCLVTLLEKLRQARPRNFDCDDIFLRSKDDDDLDGV